MNCKKNIIISIVLIIGFLIPTAVFSEGIKERMKERLPVIVDLKTKGVVGEDFNGFLAFVTDEMLEQDIVDDENQDRKTIYTYIAKKEGASVELVGQRRAQQIIEHAEPGEFFQREDGSWYQK